MDVYLTTVEELRSLRAQLAAEQQDLVALNAKYEELCRATVDDPDAALEAAVLPAQREMIKARINGLGIRIAEKEVIKAELEKPMMAAAERQRQADAEAKWEGIRAQYSKACNEFDELKAKFELATKTAPAAQEVFENALAELEQFRATPYNSVEFSPAFLANARRRDTKLQNAVREAQAERDYAFGRRDSIRRELLDLSGELARLAWLENNYRPQGVREAATATTLGEAMSRR